MSHPNNQSFVKAVVDLLTAGYDDYGSTYAAITRRAQERFEQGDWQGMRRDTRQRLDLYARVATDTADRIRTAIDTIIDRMAHWNEVKDRYHKHMADRRDAELAYTFLNSVSRKLFDIVGFDPRLAFAHSAAAATHPLPDDELVRIRGEGRIDPRTVEAVLSRYGFRVPYADVERDAELCAGKIRQRLTSADMADATGGWYFEMLKAPFFRGMSAYLVGCLCWPHFRMPLVFAIHNGRRGLYVDALLTSVEELRIVFSFSRAYFHVQCACPGALVRYLKQLMPGKRIAELYIGLGYHKHGKTELYQDLLSHQDSCRLDRFDFSPGKRGMVMVAFNMPGDDLIYKVIRDRFASPKRTSATEIRGKYDYVFKHDRAGRLVDVQTFENLKLGAGCFTPALLAEIETHTRTAVTVSREHVILHHAYVERRVIPLDLYLQTADARDARAAVIDYGQAIKDLARINVFPGDLLIKNFGVTNLGRVVFYDYDELCRLTDCNFRKLPQARRYEDELASEPWYFVAENDVFPEEFDAFLGLAPDLHQVFVRYHGDLLRPEFWQSTQQQILAGDFTHIRPYAESSRLNLRFESGGSGNS